MLVCPLKILLQWGNTFDKVNSYPFEIKAPHQFPLSFIPNLLFPVSLAVNKALACDTISVRMIKICDHALGKPLCLINNDCTKMGISQIYGKKSCSSLY